MGWYHRAVSPGNHLTVYGPSGLERRYRAFLSSTPGSAGGEFYASASTPRAAIRKVIRQAEAERDRLTALLQAVQP